MNRIKRILIACGVLALVFLPVGCKKNRGNGSSVSLGGGGSGGDGSGSTQDSSDSDKKSKTNGRISLSGPVRVIRQLTNGKILIGGEFTKPNYLAMLNPDGSLDSSFNENFGTGFNGPVHTVAVLNDGSILAGGDFTDVNGKTTGRLAKLDQNGKVDERYIEGIGSGFNGPVTSITVQKNGETIIVGSFTTFNDYTAQGSVRLSTSGVLDEAYDPGAEYEDEEEDDGKGKKRKKKKKRKHLKSDEKENNKYKDKHDTNDKVDQNENSNREKTKEDNSKKGGNSSGN